MKFLCRLITLLLLVPIALAETPDIRDSNALNAFVDGVMKTSVRKNHIVGATVVILVDDEVTVSKGYGVADLESQSPVDPEKTLFRIGSVSKLFTYVGLMQLHEQGKLDLEADIQDYLPNLDIPKTWDEPIRVKDLFTHTGGFSDRIVGLFSREESAVRPLEDILADELPPRVRKPGQVSSYSNHSLGIAGLIIENTSGMKWADYVRANILDPLGMKYATAHQPVPESLKAHSAVGYRWEGGEHKAEKFEIVPLGSAGTMSASGVEMTKFMKANLHGGELDGNRILKSSTLAQMYSPLYELHDAINAMPYGFIHETPNGLNIYSHTGGTTVFFTYFGFLPEENVGIFISTNTTGGGETMMDLVRSLFDHYYPHELDLTPVETPSDLADIVGSYVSYRHPTDSGAKLALHLLASVNVAAVEPGKIRISGGFGDPRTAIEIEPMVFQLTDEDTRIYFDIGEDGKRRLFYGNVLGSFYKTEFADSVSTNFLMAGIALILFLWALIAWPVQRLVWGRQSSDAEHRSRLSFWILGIMIFLTIVMLAANSSEEIVFGMTPTLAFWLNFAYLIPLMTLVSLYCLARLLTDKGTYRYIKVFHVALGIAAIVVSWQFYFWRFLGA